uniref:Uncharacterized protein n=1 Tax=viral metagenome TaxID=1070528 RepID=A0A6M3IEI3_9ZZZZ
MAKEKETKKKDEEWDEIDTTPRSMSVGETIEGKFSGTRPGKFGKIFMLDKGDGTVYNIYGGIQFDSVLTQDSVGIRFRIRCLGKEKTSRGMEVWTYKFHKARLTSEQT